MTEDTRVEPGALSDATGAWTPDRDRPAQVGNEASLDSQVTVKAAFVRRDARGTTTTSFA
jgi:hypothetical protein